MLYQSDMGLFFLTALLLDNVERERNISKRLLFKLMILLLRCKGFVIQCTNAPCGNLEHFKITILSLLGCVRLGYVRLG